jgi:metallo-beta-lactamase family protein
MEGTYGGRCRGAEDVYGALRDVIVRTAARGGKVVIPAFAIERTQDLLVILTELRRKGEIPNLPMYLDSPMAILATAVFARHPECLSPDIRALGAGVFETGAFHFTGRPQDSKVINDVQGPCIILASSGMAVGGRVLHHLERLLPGRENAVVLVGYQVVGTRGHALAMGASEVKIHGQMVPVGAEVVQLEGLSAHADQADLTAWFLALNKPQQVFLVHGEPASLERLAMQLRGRSQSDVVIPSQGQSVVLKPLSSAVQTGVNR